MSKELKALYEVIREQENLIPEHILYHSYADYNEVSAEYGKGSYHFIVRIRSDYYNFTKDKIEYRLEVMEDLDYLVLVYYSLTLDEIIPHLKHIPLALKELEEKNKILKDIECREVNGVKENLLKQI